jgi:hypothetical protein
VCFRPVLKLQRSFAFSGESPAMLRRSFLLLFSGESCWLIIKKKNCCLLLVIDVSDRLRCFSARTDQVIVAFDRPRCFSARTNPKIVVSDRPWCFLARTDQVIVASDRPWCFSARTDQMVVQVSDEIPTGVEVLFNYLVICFESLYCVLQAIPT